MGEHPGTWFNALVPLIPSWAQHFINVVTLASWTVIAILLVLAWVGTRRMAAVPRGWQNIWEWVCEVFRGFAVAVIGPGGERYMPLLATFFIYIFFLSLFGLIPGCISPTTTLNMTVALAIVVFFAVQYFGFRTHGLAYVKHFVGDVPFILKPVMLIVHLIGELAKPVSLSVRLFGNIFGEDQTVGAFLRLADQIQKAAHVPIPLHLPMVAFAIFGGFIQAYVFTTLTAAYIGMATQEQEHGKHKEAVAEGQAA